MRFSIHHIVVCGVLALAAAPAVGCGAHGLETSEGAETSAEASEDADAREGGESVAEAAEAITACYSTYHHGGNLWEQDYEVLQGCDCGAGNVRDFHKVWNNGNGSCYAVGWASPDPADCRVRVHIHDSAGWAWGDCNVQVEKKAAATSCAGRCGGSAPGGCFCDSLCTTYGDCCSDYVRTCDTSHSCLNHCGGATAGGCYCDDVCATYGDCCSDKSVLCPYGGG